MNTASSGDFNNLHEYIAGFHMLNFQGQRASRADDTYSGGIDNY